MTGAAVFRGEGELSSRWTKLNCDYGTVRKFTCTLYWYSTTFDFEAASKFEMTAVQAPTTPMSDSDRCRFDVHSVCMKAWVILGWASSGDTHV
jgi:hypothetical protein